MASVSTRDTWGSPPGKVAVRQVSQPSHQHKLFHCHFQPIWFLIKLFPNQFSYCPDNFQPSLSTFSSCPSSGLREDSAVTAHLSALTPIHKLALGSIQANNRPCIDGFTQATRSLRFWGLFTFHLNYFIPTIPEYLKVSAGALWCGGCSNHFLPSHKMLMELAKTEVRGQTLTGSALGLDWLQPPTGLMTNEKPGFQLNFSLVIFVLMYV